LMNATASITRTTRTTRTTRITSITSIASTSLDSGVITGQHSAPPPPRLRLSLQRFLYKRPQEL
jgi:hypothetical protein